MKCEGLGIVARDLDQLLRFLSCAKELRYLQRRTNSALAAGHGHPRIVALRGFGEGDERFLVARLVVEKRAELKLQIGVAADVSLQRK